MAVDGTTYFGDDGGLGVGSTIYDGQPITIEILSPNSGNSDGSFTTGSKVTLSCKILFSKLYFCG